VKNKFCNSKCQNSFQRNNKIKLWLEGKISGSSVNGKITEVIRDYLFKLRNNKCEECGRQNMIRLIIERFTDFFNRNLFILFFFAMLLAYIIFH